MSDEQPSKIDHLSAAIQENTRITAGMAASLTRIPLVLLAVAVMGMAAWLLYVGKIGEGNFMALALVSLSSFFGEGVGRILERLPIVGKPRADVVQKLILAAFILGTLGMALVACSPV